MTRKNIANTNKKSTNSVVETEKGFEYGYVENPNSTPEEKPVNITDIVRATETFRSYGLDVKASGFNFLGKFTVIISEHSETSIQAMSVIVNVHDIDDIISDVKHLGMGLVKTIAEMSQKSEFSMNPDLNEDIPWEEACGRIRRLASTLEKKGWTPGMSEWDFRKFEEKFPKGYIRCLTRAILEGAVGKVQCLGCKHVTYLDGGIMKCDRTTTKAPLFQAGVPSRLQYAAKMESRYHQIYSDIICDYENPCYCLHEKATWEYLNEKMSEQK